MLISTIAFGQFRQTSTPRTDIIKYDFSTYQGTPIQTGWLFSDDAYKKLYLSYTAADSIIQKLETYDAIVKKIDTLHRAVVAEYEARIKDKDIYIKKQEADIDNLKKLFDDSDKNVKKFEKQFIKIGGIYIHKGTAVKVGLSFGFVGYLIGSTHH